MFKEKSVKNDKFDFYKTVTKKIPDFTNTNKELEGGGYGQEKEKKFLDKFRNVDNLIFLFVLDNYEFRGQIGVYVK